MDRPHTSYSRFAVFLHWAIALLIFCLLGLGIVMTRLPEKEIALMFKLYQLHKSLGISVLLLSIIRLLWRFSTKQPVAAPGSKLEQRMAKIAHISLYILAFLTPLLGWALVSASPYNIPTLIFGVVEWPHISFFAALDNKEATEAILSEMHEIAAFTLLLVALLHMGAALRHHFVLKDTIVSRMIPFLNRNNKSDP
ncbi:MAG: cytochrome b [Kordiimonadaceae bacterium]|nr:cytochrome b [Kordiimonadaceae bacterium]